jgi:mono/diheme cytochrome c family protein
MKALGLMALMFCAPLGVYADEGKQAFDAKCAKCHAQSGTGTFMLSRRHGSDKGMLEHRTDLAPELIRHVVRNGIVSMPALTRVEVTDAELDAIVRYLTRTSAANP